MCYLTSAQPQPPLIIVSGKTTDRNHLSIEILEQVLQKYETEYAEDDRAGRSVLTLLLSSLAPRESMIVRQSLKMKRYGVVGRDNRRGI